MRDLFDIENDMKELELQMELNRLRHNKLIKERYDAQYIEVSWEDAEKFFIENGTPFGERPHVRSCGQYSNQWSLGHMQDISVHDNEEGTGKEIWLGGYRHRDGYRRGQSIFIERKYEARFKK